ncbi:MAG: hypothetical protein QM760_05945 [Nibricoccus sp.]
MNAHMTTNSSNGGGGDVSPVSSGPRVAPNQWRVLGGVWRLTAWQFLARNHLLTVAGMTVMWALMCSRFVAPRQPWSYLDWLMEFFLSVVVPVLAFLSGAGAMRDQLKSSSTDYVFTRPVRRWAFVPFKYLAHVPCMMISWLPAFGVAVFFAAQRNVANLSSVSVAVLMAQMLTIAGFTSLGFLCAMLTQRYLVVGIVYAAIVEVGVGNIPAPLSGISITRQIREFLEPVMGKVPQDVSWPEVLSATGTVLALSAGFVAVTALLFSMKELTGERAKD